MDGDRDSRRRIRLELASHRGGNSNLNMLPAYAECDLHADQRKAPHGEWRVSSSGGAGISSEHRRTNSGGSWLVSGVAPALASRA